MIRETRELLAALTALNRAVPNVVMRIVDESLPVADQVEFGDVLIEVGERIRQHAAEHRTTVVDSPNDSPRYSPCDIKNRPEASHQGPAPPLPSWSRGESQ